MHNRGVVYVVYGENARQEAEMSIQSLRLWNDLPVTVIGDEVIGADHIPFESIDRGGRWAKLNLNNLSPYQYTLYIDADTRPRGDLSAGFAILADGWDMAFCPSSQQGRELLWHVGDEERGKTLELLGYEPVQLQAGVIFVAKNERTERLFECWRSEWLLYKDQDQAAFLRALAISPVRLWLLGSVYNGGALVSHLFGKARE